jgi:hypothetical protein
MRPRPQVRFYCLMLASPMSVMLGLEYLLALDASGLGVRACPIGAAYLSQPPWNQVLNLFDGELTEKYVNVVCAPVGYLLGAPTTGVDFAGKKGDPGVVYQPQTALAGLHTAGVPNVAITLAPVGRDEHDHEIQALKRYDLVLCPNDSHVQAFAEIGVSAHHVPSDAGQLARLFSVLLG